MGWGTLLAIFGGAGQGAFFMIFGGVVHIFGHFLWGGAHFWSIFGGAGRKILPEKFRLGRNFHAFHIG